MADAPQITIHSIGEERQPVLVIDHFSPDPEAMIDEANALAWGRYGPHYPGLRAPVPPATLSRFLPALVRPMAQAFALTAAPQLIEAFYSLVTTPPEQLAPIQRLPHFDGLERERLAVLHFLSRDESTGTAFYRHRATGFETVDAARFATFRTRLEAEVARDGLPIARYISGDTDQFEQIARFEGRFNRVLIYRGHALHCAALSEAAILSADPRRGRLTVNTFLSAPTRG
jgi:hypothetical protein